VQKSVKKILKNAEKDIPNFRMFLARS